MSTKPRFKIIKKIILSVLDEVEDEVLLMDVGDEVNKRVRAVLPYGTRKEAVKSPCYIANIARNNGFITYNKKTRNYRLVEINGQKKMVLNIRRLKMLRRDSDANN